VVSLVSQGLGVALVPSALHRAALRGAVFRPLEEDVAGSDAYCVWRSGPDNIVVQNFLRAVQKAVRS
jgi:DNA-binding transcriptional LysR family regulator